MKMNKAQLTFNDLHADCLQTILSFEKVIDIWNHRTISSKWRMIVPLALARITRVHCSCGGFLVGSPSYGACDCDHGCICCCDVIKLVDLCPNLESFDGIIWPWYQQVFFLF